jgi:multiple sugar transport system permease protein
MDAANVTVEETAVDATTPARSTEPVRLPGERPAARPRARRSPLTWARNGGLTTLLFALPMLLVFGAFSWFPAVRLLVMSVQKTNLVDPATWVGLDNFRSVLDDPLFPKAVRNTGYFALLALIFGYPVPLVAAVLMSEARRFRGLFSFLAYLPVVLPPVVAVLLWKVFYDGGPHGVFNTVLGWVGLGPYQWISSQTMAMPSLVLESTWANAGTTVIIYLAALTAVNSDLYEAASVDGASLWRKVWHITIPQLRGVLLLTFMLQIIGTAQVFIEPFLFTSGGPANATLTVLLLIYQYAFGNSLGASYGEAAALSVMLAGSLALFSVVFMRLTRSWSTA